MSQEIYMALRSIAIANESTRRGWSAFEEKNESLLMNYPTHGDDEDALLKSIGAKLFEQYSESQNHVLFDHLTVKWAFGAVSYFSNEFNAIVSPSGIMYLDKGGNLVLWTTSLDRDDATWDVYKERYSNKWDVVDTYCDYNARDLWYLFD